jgi:hypothetical protein
MVGFRAQRAGRLGGSAERPPRLAWALWAAMPLTSGPNDQRCWPAVVALSLVTEISAGMSAAGES